jgi:hypothetical protein
MELEHEVSLCELVDWKVDELGIGCAPFEDLMSMEE